MSSTALGFYLLGIVFFISKEYIILNEEFIIICSFLLVFGLLIKFLGQSMTEELDRRSGEIRHSFVSLMDVKRSSLLKFINTNERQFLLVADIFYLILFAADELIRILNNRDLLSKQQIHLLLESFLELFRVQLDQKKKQEINILSGQINGKMHQYFITESEIFQEFDLDEICEIIDSMIEDEESDFDSEFEESKLTI